MEKNSRACPWGECPGLDGGPRSREHEARFGKGGKAEGQMTVNSAASMLKDGSASNTVKQGDNLR
jgi:hypothetical protein